MLDNVIHFLYLPISSFTSLFLSLCLVGVKYIDVSGLKLPCIFSISNGLKDSQSQEYVMMQI